MNASTHVARFGGPREFEQQVAVGGTAAGVCPPTDQRGGTDGDRRILRRFLAEIAVA